MYNPLTQFSSPELEQLLKKYVEENTCRAEIIEAELIRRRSEETDQDLETKVVAQDIIHMTIYKNHLFAELKELLADFTKNQHHRTSDVTLEINHRILTRELEDIDQSDAYYWEVLYFDH